MSEIMNKVSLFVWRQQPCMVDHLILGVAMVLKQCNVRASSWHILGSGSSLCWY